MKRKIFFIPALLFIGTLILSEENPLQLKLLFRIMHPENDRLSEIKKEDFKLFINEKPVQIVNILKRTRSLAERPETGRHFFLSFQICNQDKILMSAISHLITEILSQKDSLHVLSPVKIHSIPVSGNKGAILNRIEQIINSDCLQFNQAMQIHEKRMENEVKQLNWILNVNPGGASQRSALNRFIKNLSLQFSAYKKEFLSPDMLKYQNINDLFLNLKGERWFIHFQQNRVFFFLGRLNRLIQSLRQYRYYPLLKAIVHYQNETRPSKLFPFESIRNLMVENQIGFHVLLFDEARGIQAEISDHFKKICRESGGTFLKVHSPLSAIQKIKCHEDFFYELTCHISPESEAKQVLIISDNDQHQLIYKHQYSNQEITTLLSDPTENKITISNISILKNKITFLLKDYKINATTGFGLIKIQLNLSTPSDRSIFFSENTLRAFRDQTRISVLIPPYPDKVVNLTITVNDLLANHSRRNQYQVYLRNHGQVVLPLRGVN
jgi:hypothetical protein